LAQFNVKSYKAIKTKCGAKLILSYFEKLADLEVAKKKTFQLKNKGFQWTKYSSFQPRHNDKKKNEQSS
jgi:hypothetical protein